MTESQEESKQGYSYNFSGLGIALIHHLNGIDYEDDKIFIKFFKEFVQQALEGKKWLECPSYRLPFNEGLEAASVYFDLKKAVKVAELGDDVAVLNDYMGLLSKLEEGKDLHESDKQQISKLIKLVDVGILL